MHHAVGELSRVLFTAKVQTPDLPRIPPLVERRRRLVIFDPADQRTVDDHLKTHTDDRQESDLHRTHQSSKLIK